MQATALHQPLNTTQRFVLQTFLTVQTEKERDELTSLYLDYIQRRLDIETNKWWDENNMTDEKLDEILNTHNRTPYK
jgi:hypothetical protein